MIPDGTKAILKTGLLAIATILVLSGCKTVGPDFEKPEVPVADNWLDAENQHVEYRNEKGE